VRLREWAAVAIARGDQPLADRLAQRAQDVAAGVQRDDDDEVAW
jgi:hypothetical protein